MGVHGLWRLLESTGKPINPETLEGKILAVGILSLVISVSMCLTVLLSSNLNQMPPDISIWLNQAVKGVRDRDGNNVQNAHLLTLFNRICKLLFFRIRPVFVFDGDAPLLKKQTLTLRRQRKEELSRESKQTNEKLLKTFLKRQAIKAALGDRSQDPLPSLSSVTRNEVDDMYVLPALPPAEENDRSRSESSEEEEEEEEEKESEEMDSFSIYQDELYDNPNSVDINSEEFACLPPEMKHEILKDMKEFSKRRRTMYQKPPELSGDFSQYQLAGLLQRNNLNQRLESSAKSKPVPEDQPAAAPWSGSSLSGCRRRAVDRPEPLWKPVCEEEEEEEEVGPSSKDAKPSASKPSHEDASPPSPRTLKAIQAAMNDSSDEEKEDKKDLDKKDGRVSPRTLMAIQQVLAEEEDGAVEHETLISSSSVKLQANVHHPAPLVVLSSSEEETRPDDAKSLPNKTSEFKRSSTSRAVHVEDSLLVSSSEDEMEEVIGQRNKALHLAVQQQPPERELMSEEKTGSREQAEKQEEKERRETLITNREHLVQLQDSAVNTSTEAPKETNGDDVKTDDGEQSESEESFIEVSEEEFKEEHADDLPVIVREGGQAAEEETKQKEKQRRVRPRLRLLM
ncbi:hypothetical protein INR49_016316 [Caranx melampygus]|nr:hypothetical protein INR49_016316 [Caranx melampygus]